jgi:hypothetical protein
MRPDWAGSCFVSGVAGIAISVASQAKNAGVNVGAVCEAADAAPTCRRHVNNCDADKPYRRAVAEIRRGPSKLSATIRAFSSSVQRRRAPLEITSSREIFGIGV